MKTTRILATLLLALVGAPTLSEVLVTVDGDRIEIDGPWEVKGRRVQFTDVHGTLRSLSLSAVDLEASEEASSAVASAPSEAAPREPRSFVRVAPALLARPDRSGSARVIDVRPGRGRTGSFASEAEIEALLEKVPEDELTTVAFDMVNLGVRMIEVDRRVDLLSRTGVRTGAREMARWIPEVRAMEQRARSEAAKEVYRLTAREMRMLADLAERSPDAAIAELRENLLELRRELR